MNMHTTFPATGEPMHDAPGQRFALPMSELMALIGKAMAIADVSEGEFSRAIVGNGALLSTIRQGRQPFRRTRLRMEDHARALLDHSRRLAFSVLWDHFDQQDAEATIESMIAELDRRQGDIDLELTGTEDDFMQHAVDGPGCPIADAGLADQGALREDDEDDDPAEDDLEDRCAGGDDHMIAGPVTQREWWERHEAHTGQAVGDDVDASRMGAGQHGPPDGGECVVTAPFSARAWVSRWEEAGGGWGMVGDRLSFMLPEPQNNLPVLMSEIAGEPERLAAVRAYVIARP